MKMDDDVCLCFHVKMRKIIRFIRVEKPKKASQLSNCFGAGTGCGWCRPFLRQLLKKHGEVVSEPSMEDKFGDLEAISGEDYEAQRREYRRKQSEM